MLVYSVSALLLLGAGGVSAQNVSLKYNVDKRVAFSQSHDPPLDEHDENAESVDQSTVHQSHEWLWKPYSPRKGWPTRVITVNLCEIPAGTSRSSNAR